MNNRLTQWIESIVSKRWFLPVLLVLAAAFFLLATVSLDNYEWLYFSILALFLIALRPSSSLHNSVMEDGSLLKTMFTVLIALCTIAVCILPMDALPLWNGEIPDHRNQYELLAESLLQGRVDIPYGDESELLKLVNPYDPNERDAAGIYYHWDHAFYDGHYYVYFGVVPVLLLFLPYRLLTGTALTTFHATQIFVAIFIIGIFALFHLLCRVFFKKMPHSVYLATSVAFSVMSVWYCTAEPALYCTAISAGLALEVWSLFFFVLAVWGERRENLQILYATIGALLGALVFGCRPSIALANILVIPMLIEFLRQRKFSVKLLGKLFLAAFPYVLVAAGLMYYNTIRFDSPFEFGQAYQLTVADQSQYRFVLNRQTLLRMINETANNLFAVGRVQEAFPYLNASSAFYNFPILFLCFTICKSGVFHQLRQNKLLGLVIGIFVTVLIISGIDVMWTPYLLERYRMDIYFLLGIACFIVIGCMFCTVSQNRKGILSFTTLVLSLSTVVSSILLCISTVGVYYPEKVAELALTLHLG